MYEKNKAIANKIILCILGFGLAAYFVRKYRFSKVKNLKNITSNEEETENIVIVKTVEECQLAAQTIQRKCAKFRVLGFDCEWVRKEGRRSPVALMQIATEDGFCALFRLCMLKEIPQDLAKILEDKTIFKVGVVPSDDANYLMQDYGVLVQGCLDLRHLLEQSRQLPRGGLSGLARSFLGIEMDKSWQICCSDWEAPSFSSRQVRYASQDALVAVDIFSCLMQQRLRPWWHIWGTVNPDWPNVVAICHNYLDLKYKNKFSQGDGSHSASRQIGGRPNKPASRAYSTRQKPLYENCILQAPDGEVLATCDHKKAEWYLFKNLGTKISDNPLVVRLSFEPAGRAVDEVGHYYTIGKENRCVVCGSTESYIRKNVVPHEYRKYFYVVMKDHISHDILLLCLNCHLKSTRYDTLLRQQLASECNAPIGTGDDAKTLELPDLKRVRSAARALLSPQAEEIPEQRRKELQCIVLRHFGAEEGTEVTAHMLQEANDLVVSVMNEKYESHGLRVVTHFSRSENGGLVHLEQKWRAHFLATMQPQYLPPLWSVTHNQNHLEQLITQGRILQEEVSVAGLN